MKILMLVPYLPTITMSGGQTRWYNIIRFLAKKHDITLFSLIKDKSEERFIPELQKYCKKVKVFKRPEKPWTLRNILLSEFGPFPLLVIRNWSFEERFEIKKELTREKYDLIHAETFYVMPHLVKTDVPTILVEQTMWHDVYKHHVVHKIPKIFRPFFMLDVLKVKFWEKHYWRKADMLVAVSEEDRQEMIKLIPDVDVDIIPNGVDTNYYQKKKNKILFPLRILYGVTNFEWLQNQEATEILINKVWPIIKKQIKDAKIWIVGRQIPDWVKKKSEQKDIDITENIADARDAYSKSSIMVAPIKGGGGTRLKVLEAMASGLPVVSTPTGVAGLKVEHGKQALIAETTLGLANEAIKLLKNSEMREKIGLEGKYHVAKYFDWESIVKLHDKVYDKAINIKKVKS
jgi:glycosyltransferase involved in cell wall biosynthesis